MCVSIIYCLCASFRLVSLDFSSSSLVLTLLEATASCPLGWASLVAQMIMNLPAMQETQVRSLAWEDSLEKGKATHSCILATDRGAWRVAESGPAERLTACVSVFSPPSPPLSVSVSFSVSFSLLSLSPSVFLDSSAVLLFRMCTEGKGQKICKISCVLHALYVPFHLIKLTPL